MNSELIIKGEDGCIQSEDSHGHDPEGIEGVSVMDEHTLKEDRSLLWWICDSAKAGGTYEVHLSSGTTLACELSPFGDPSDYIRLNYDGGYMDRAGAHRLRSAEAGLIGVDHRCLRTRSADIAPGFGGIV